MKRIKILVIGKKSLLASCIKNNSKIKNIKFIQYKNLKNLNLNTFSHIINFSIDPKNFTNEYSHVRKIDKNICNLIKKNNYIYIFPSSRLIYKKSKNNFYGRNKRKTEIEIKKIVKKYLILRISTLLTFDYSNRNLFISKALKSLKTKKKIEIDISKNTYKDFITSKFFAYIFDKLVKKNITGTYNLSSNIPIKVNEILKNLIKGYGKGEVVLKKPFKKNHSFVLNNVKLKNKVKFKLSKKDILNYCVKLGKQLNA